MSDLESAVEFIDNLSKSLHGALQHERDFEENTTALNKLNDDKRRLENALTESSNRLDKINKEADVRKASSEEAAKATDAYAQEQLAETIKKAKQDASDIIADAENRKRAAKIDVDGMLQTRSKLETELKELQDKISSLKLAHENLKRAVGL